MPTNDLMIFIIIGLAALAPVANEGRHVHPGDEPPRSCGPECIGIGRQDTTLSVGKMSVDACPHLRTGGAAS